MTTMYPRRRIEETTEAVSRLRPQLDRLVADWTLPATIADDLQKLVLYDIIILCDDSGSMLHEEGGTRIQDLQLIVGYVAQVASIFDLDGITVRFLNTNLPAGVGDSIRDRKAAEQLITQVSFRGITPLGTALEQKILKPFVYDAPQKLDKPILVICITDGIPAGEPLGKLFDVIKHTSILNKEYGGGVIAFSFGQVGTDKNAEEFLHQLDSHPDVGRMVDVTSNYQIEESQLRKKGLRMTKQLWIAKLMLGAIDKRYDQMDEFCEPI